MRADRLAPLGKSHPGMWSGGPGEELTRRGQEGRGRTARCGNGGSTGGTAGTSRGQATSRRCGGGFPEGEGSAFRLSDASTRAPFRFAGPKPEPKAGTCLRQHCLLLSSALPTAAVLPVVAFEIEKPPRRRFFSTTLPHRTVAAVSG